ncbi:hypothetical protein B0H21DRAFT_895174 [Amylocystis lapponica]|nr:hypothetical protein B0H21DRAFT_895174 [Amylocystis lapponica]
MASSHPKRPASTEPDIQLQPPIKIPIPCQSSTSPDLKLDDFLTEAQHRAQDQVVLQAMYRHTAVDIKNAAALLQAIVKQCPRQLKQEYIDFQAGDALIDERPELVDLLSEAFKAGQFAKIRNLKYLHEPKKPRPPPESPRLIMDKEEQSQAIERAWNVEYQDDHHVMLYEAICDMKRDTPYTNTVSIIQSSGTGKSRMVDEQAKLVFTIPFNLRDMQESEDGLAFPYPDCDVRDHLLVPKNRPLAFAQLHYLSFYTHLFHAIIKRLSDSEAHGTYALLATWWRNYLIKSNDQNVSNRTALYQDAIDTQTRGTIYATPVMNADSLDSAWEGPLDTAQTRAKEALVLLIDKITNLSETPHTSSTAVKLMFYFDEAHMLPTTLVKGDSPEKSLYDVMCSTFDTLRLESTAVFAIFLSTNSSLAKFAPVGRQANSARARENAHDLQAPLTEIPFDCSDRFPLRMRNLTMNDLCKMEFMARFGRPLFWTLYRGARDKAKVSTDLIGLARAKLILRPDIGRAAGYGIRPDDEMRGRLAVVDVRIMLDYEPRRMASMEADLVEHNMRLAYSVPKNREYLRPAVGYIPHTPQGTIPEILKEGLSGGILDLGERGEIVARALFTLAYDSTVEKEHPDAGSIKYSKGCSLIGFIEKLFAQDYATAVLDSPPYNVKSDRPFRESFKDAQIRFTHFGKMYNDGCINTHAMLAAFVRGMAFVCRNGETLVDFIVPVLQKPGNMLESSMTALFVQVKRRERRGTKNKYDIDVEKFDFFQSLDEEFQERPVITLVMELGVQRPISQEQKDEKPSRQVKKSKPSGEKSSGKGRNIGQAQFSTAQQKDKNVETSPPHVPAGTALESLPNNRFVRLSTPEPQHTTRLPFLPPTPAKVEVPKKGTKRHWPIRHHPRYNIFAYGCSHNVYAVIKPQEKELYALLMASGDFLDEHPRRGKAIAAVLKMKPFYVWKPKVWVWAWEEDERATVFGEEVEETNVEGVLVASQIDELRKLLEDAPDELFKLLEDDPDELLKLLEEDDEKTEDGKKTDEGAQRPEHRSDVDMEDVM